jgi:FRG domain
MIQSIEDFIRAVRDDSSSWHPKEPKWFRGERQGLKPLLPSLYRKDLGAHENALLQMFRARASGYHDVVPDRERTDHWLFLARHVRLPTRLLDWTEGALIALHFALQEEDPVVWMLNPHELNRMSMPSLLPDPSRIREFPLIWHDPDPEPPPWFPKARSRIPLNPAFENLRGAWEQDRFGVELPVAVYPTYVHARLRAQRSCFTIHGKRKEGLNELVSGSILKRYLIDPTSRDAIRGDLRLLAVTDSVAFPDLDGLARELESQFS